MSNPIAAMYGRPACAPAPGRRAEAAAAAARAARAAREPRPAVSSNIDRSRLEVFQAVDSFMNLGSRDRFSHYARLDPEQKKEFGAVLAKLLKTGFMGFEIHEVDGRREKRFAGIDVGARREAGVDRLVTSDPGSEWP